MKPGSSRIGVNITSNPDLRDSCWIVDNPEVPPIPRCSSDRSPEAGISDVTVGEINTSKAKI
jgi:hypothetical protein